MRNWYSFEAKANNTAELFIYGSIGAYGISAKMLIEQLKQLGSRDLTLRIHSPGGSVFDGTAIFSALKQHKGRITTQIDGLCASMATYIAIAGKPVRMAEGAYYMIHNASGASWGNSKELRKDADLIEKLSNTLAEAYQIKTGLPLADIQKMMDEETWMTAKEAKAKGFIDEITPEVKATACFESGDLSAFTRTPPEIKALVAADDDGCRISCSKENLFHPAYARQQTPAPVAGMDEETAGIVEQYNALMQSRRFTEASAFWFKHEAALTEATRL